MIVDQVYYFVVAKTLQLKGPEYQRKLCCCVFAGNFAAATTTTGHSATFNNLAGVQLNCGRY